MTGTYGNQRRHDNGTFGSAIHDSDTVGELPVARTVDLSGLNPREYSFERTFLDGYREDPTGEYIASWERDTAHPEQTEPGDPMRELSDADRKRLAQFVAMVRRRHNAAVSGASPVDLDQWAPGEDVDADSLVLAELEGLFPGRLEATGYEPGQNADADALVVQLLSAHRQFNAGFWLTIPVTEQKAHLNPADWD